MSETPKTYDVIYEQPLTIRYLDSVHNAVVHDGVDVDRDTVPTNKPHYIVTRDTGHVRHVASPRDHLLRRHGPVLHAHVHDLELVRAGEDEEDAGAALAAAEDAAEPEDHHFLVLLDHLEDD